MKYVIPVILCGILLLPAYAQKKNINTSPDGYGSISWGTLINDAEKKIKGKRYYTDDKKIIRSREGEIEYYYGFFSDGKNPQGKLFYVSVKFPYLTLETVQNKVENAYGESTNEQIKNNQGALIWDTEKTIIIIWVDRYDNRAYSRRISYISKEIAAEVNKYQENLFNAKELEIIEKLNP